MSLETGFSKKLTLGPPGSSHHHHHQQTERAISPSSTDSSPKSSPSKSAKLSLKNFGSSVRARSPIRRQQTLAASTSGRAVSQERPSSKSCKKKEEASSSVKDLGEYIPGTSGPPGVDNFPTDSQSQGGKTPGVANKIIHNWKSACGRTKVKTKDFLKRWKTLPENHPDFDQIPGATVGAGDSPPGSSSNIPAAVAAVSLSQPSQYAGGEGGGGSSGNLGSSSAGITGSTTSGLGRLKNLTKKTSEAEMPQGTSGGFFGKVGGGGSTISGNANGPSYPQDMDTSSGINGAKSSTGWSVHVWATYVQRGNDEDVTLHEETKPGRDLLTEFQKIKLTHFFRHVLDMNHDDVISAEDFVALNQRIRHYIEWSSECIEFHILKEVHSGFLECFLNQPLDDSSVMYYCSSERETRQHVNIDEWLDVWGTLLASARTMESLPLWLQYFPKILFQVINKSGSGTISKEQLRAFYTMFLGIDFRIVNETLDSIYDAMTDGGRNKITYGLFKLCFANFLLGKYPHGPGQYLFGICAPATLGCAFPIDYSALNTSKDDLEPYDPDKDKGQTNRRSVIVVSSSPSLSAAASKLSSSPTNPARKTIVTTAQEKRKK